MKVNFARKNGGGNENIHCNQLAVTSAFKTIWLESGVKVMQQYV